MQGRPGDPLYGGKLSSGALKPHIEPFINYTPAELLRHHLLHDGRHGVAAAHPDALLHHPFGASSTGVGGVVAAVHLPAVLLGAGLRGVLEAGGVHQHHRQGCDAHPALAVHLGRVGLDPDLRQERRQSSKPSSMPARRSPGIPASFDCRTSSSTGRDRALHPGDRGSSLRDLGPGRCRRSRRRALDRRRAPARHRQRAQSRYLLQDDRPQRADDPSADGGPGAACSSWPWLRRRWRRPNRGTSWPWSAGRSRWRWPETSR